MDDASRADVDSSRVRPDRESWRGSRELAIACVELSFHDDCGESLTSIEIGGDEGGVSFGDGVFSPEKFGGDSRRWFGGSGGTAIIQVADDVAADATELRLDGSPIESGISVRAVVDDDAAEAVDMGPEASVSFLETCLDRLSEVIHDTDWCPPRPWD